MKYAPSPTPTKSDGLLEYLAREFRRLAAHTHPDSVLSGNGTPEGAVAAPVGVLYLRTDGGTSTTLYVKESGSGNTGWVAK